MDGILKMQFTPLSWHVPNEDDDKYIIKVALYNTKEKKFHMGEIEYDGLNLRVWYDMDLPDDIGLVDDVDGWYYMKTEDDIDNEEEINE